MFIKFIAILKMMAKPKYLYHGSKLKLIGNKLIPRKAKDLSDFKVNNQKAVYATDRKQIAIAMALVNERHIRAGMDFEAKKVQVTIWKGMPRKKYFYLYTLPIKTFIEKPGGSHQWLSSISVKPIKIERLKTKDFKKLIRKPAYKEKKEYQNKYGAKINLT